MDKHFAFGWHNNDSSSKRVAGEKENDLQHVSGGGLDREFLEVKDQLNCIGIL